MVEVDSKEDDGKDEAEMDSEEEETTLSEEADNDNKEQGMSKVSESVERSLAKGLSDIVDMCEGRIELDYDEEDLEEGKDYEKELWEAFEELEALNNKRETKKANTEQTFSSSSKPKVAVAHKQLASRLAARKESGISQEEKVLAGEERKQVPTIKLPARVPPRKQQDLKTSQEVAQRTPTELQSDARAKPSKEKPEMKKIEKLEVKKIEKPEVKNIKKPEANKIEKPEVKKLEKPEVKKTNNKEELQKEESNGVPWFQLGIFFVCKSFVFSEGRACGRRCNGRKIFKEHLTQGGFLAQKMTYFKAIVDFSNFPFFRSWS